MLTIEYWMYNKEIQLAGEASSVISLAHMLEERKVEFKIHEAGLTYGQKHFGMGGFEHWLEGTDKFFNERVTS